MYMAIIEGYNNIMAFNTDKELAKVDAIARAKKFYQDEVNAPYGLESWTWGVITEYFTAYIIMIENDLVMDEDGIKSGRYDKNISYK